MGTTSSVNSLLSSLNTSSNDSLSALLGESNSGNTNAGDTSELQSAVNSILNSATSTSGSGLDVQSTVDAILQIDAQPEINLQNQVTALNSQTSALKQIESDLTSLQTAVQALSDPMGAFGSLAVSSSNNNVVSATASNGTTAGTHTILVSSLATTAAQYSAAFDSASSTLPTGSISLLVGAASPTNQAVPIPIDSTDGTNSLSGLAKYINQHNLGVSASVITDASGARLALVSQTSGTGGKITLTDNTTAEESTNFSSPGATLTSGSFDLQVGSNTAVTIPVDSSDGTNTLSGLESYINKQNLGVSASIVTDGSGSRLVLTTQDPQGLSISTDNTGLDFRSVNAGMGFTQAVDSTTGQPLGTDASLSVDGIPITSASNTVTGVIPGTTLTLSGVSTNPVTLAIQPDLTTVATALNNFITAYNQTIKDINAQYTYDGTQSSAPPLLGDAALDILQEQLLSGISTSISGNNGLVNLQSIGIQVQQDGSLSVVSTNSADSMSLNDALISNFSAVQNLFQSSGGVAQILNTTLTSLTDTVNGPLNADMNSINNEVTDLNNQITDFQAQLQQTQQQLLTEYSRINTMLEQLPQTLASINSQLDALNPKSS